jgi:hypothetical protein
MVSAVGAAGRRCGLNPIEQQQLQREGNGEG